jgi:hypothetical protein
MPVCGTDLGATPTILTEFADKGRYNHLDTLGSSTVTSEDAGPEWDNTVLPLLIERHLSATVQEAMFQNAGFRHSVTAAGGDDYRVLGFRHDINSETHTDAPTVELLREHYRRMNPENSSFQDSNAHSIMLRGVIEVGDQVRIGESGGSIFVVRVVDGEEGRAVIESVDASAAGRYPFSMPLEALVRVDPGE